MEQWMRALTCAGYEYMKLMVAELQRQLNEIERSKGNLERVILYNFKSKINVGSEVLFLPYMFSIHKIEENIYIKLKSHGQHYN